MNRGPVSEATLKAHREVEEAFPDRDPDVSFSVYRELLRAKPEDRAGIFARYPPAVWTAESMKAAVHLHYHHVAKPDVSVLLSVEVTSSYVNMIWGDEWSAPDDGEPDYDAQEEAVRRLVNYFLSYDSEGGDEEWMVKPTKEQAVRWIGYLQHELERLDPLRREVMAEWSHLGWTPDHTRPDAGVPS